MRKRELEKRIYTKDEKNIEEDENPTPPGGGIVVVVEVGYTIHPANHLAENVFKDNKSAPKQLITSRLFVCVASQKFWPRENGTARNKSKYSHTHTHTHTLKYIHIRAKVYIYINV